MAGPRKADFQAPRRLILDSGAVIALARGDQRARAVRSLILRAGTPLQPPRGAGVKPGASAPGSTPPKNPKPQRGAGSRLGRLEMPASLRDFGNEGAPTWALKRQASNRFPYRARRPAYRPQISEPQPVSMPLLRYTSKRPVGVRYMGGIHCTQPSSTSDCFLCNPDTGLLYLTIGDCFALVGLGPLVSGYSVVSTRSHVRSAADLEPGKRKEFTEFSQSIRIELARMFGSCIIAEHGRMPVCFRQTGLSEPHCYHAHFLLFPGVPSVDGLAVPYFRSIQVYSDLKGALDRALELEGEYYLLSSAPDRFLVMEDPVRHVRQFSRALVAAAVGKPHLADWQEHPNLDDALANATRLKALFSG